jgi:DNA invertase Pin-like site-specific DNA recombinase
MVRRPQLTEAKPWTLIRNPHGDQKLIGYARVSTREQNLDTQLLRLRELTCGRVYAEKCSGSQGPRPGWEALLQDVRAGDVVCVLRIDRMGRKLSELARSMDTIRDLGAHVRSIEETIDTSTKGGRLAFDMVSVFAQKAHSDIVESTRAGLAAAKLRGKVLGRKRKLEPAKIAHVAHLRSQGYSLREIGRATELGKTTVETALKLAAAMRGDPRQMQLTGTEAP